MQEIIQTEHTPGEGSRILFVLGWGVTLHDSGIIWFTRQAKAQDWDMTTVQLPNGYRSYKAVLEQIEAVAQAQQSDVIISFSMGALFSAYLEAPLRIFISPYWANPREKLLLGSYAFSRFVMQLLHGIRLAILPRGFRNQDIGSIEVSDLIPSFISPATVNEVLKAQSRRPPTRAEDRIFFCPTDTIIDIAKCNETTSYTFSGGHDFMATEDRETVFGQIVELVSAHCELALHKLG